MSTRPTNRIALDIYVNRDPSVSTVSIRLSDGSDKCYYRKVQTVPIGLPDPPEGGPSRQLEVVSWHEFTESQLYVQILDFLCLSSLESLYRNGYSPNAPVKGDVLDTSEGYKMIFFILCELDKHIASLDVDELRSQIDKDLADSNSYYRFL
jgi:hypothetical protein